MLRNSSFNSDNLGWAQFLPDRANTAPLTGDHHVPWVVIGAGFTGISCARRLAQLHPDKEIWLIDARQVGQAASGRNSGFVVGVTNDRGILRGDDTSEYKRINRLNQNGLDILRQQVKQFNIDCDWSEDGYYHTAADEFAMREYDIFRNCLESMDIAHTAMDHKQTAAALGTKLYKASILVPNGVLVQPASLVRGLADNLTNNVRLIEQNPVLKLETGSTPLLHLQSAKIKAEKLLLATNFEAGKLGFLQRQFIGSTLTASITRVLSEQEMASLGSVKEWGILSLHNGGATLRLTRDNRICIRNTAEYYGGKLLPTKKLKERQKIHRAAFDKRFPQLSDVPFETSWSCVEGISANGTNYFGKVAKNTFVAAGFNGSGLSRGTALGHGLAEYSSGGQSDLINDCLAAPKPTWLPPRPLLDIGAYFTVRSRFKGVGLDR